MITEKNKEELEKIGCGEELNNYCYCGKIEELTDAIHLCPTCHKVRQERIKTSILWCEDEIEFLERLLWEDTYVILKGADLIISKKSELHTHLTYLKEQEKDLK